MSNNIGAVFSIKDEFSGKIDGIVGKVGGAEKALKGATTKFKSFGSAAKKSAKVVAGVATGMVAFGTATFAATNKVVSGFDDIAKTAPKLGISTDALQEMDYWAGQNGVSSQDMEKAVGRLNQRIGEAAKGNEKYSNVLTDLGVDMEEVKSGTLSTEDAMAQSIQSLSEMTNEQEKSAMASELFGKKLGRELMPALQDGSLSLEDAKKKAEELGIVIDGDTLAAAEEFADTWDDLSRTMTMFGKKVLADLMPVFQGVMEWVIDNMPMIRDKVASTVDSVWSVLKSVYSKLEPSIVWVSEVGLPAIATGFDFVRDKVEGFLSKLRDSEGTFGQFRIAVTNIFENVKNIISGAVEVITIVWSKVAPAFEVAWNVIKGLFKTGVGFVVSAVESVTTIFSGLTDFVAGVFTGDWSRAWEGVVSIFDGIFSGITTLAKAPINAVADLVNGLIGGLNKISLPDWVPGLGGKGINIPLIPRLAKGTNNWGGGIAQVHERGGEIIDLPSGSRVYPHDKTVSMAREQGRKESKGNTINITMNGLTIREDADIDKLVNQLVKKLQGTELNMA